MLVTLHRRFDLAAPAPRVRDRQQRDLPPGSRLLPRREQGPLNPAPGMSFRWSRLVAPLRWLRGQRMSFASSSPEARTAIAGGDAMSEYADALAALGRIHRKAVR